MIYILLIILIIYYYETKRNHQYFESENIVSQIDGKSYKVVKKYEDREHAAILISQINNFAKLFIDTLKKVYIDYPNINTKDYIKGYDATKILLTKYNPDVLTENDPISPDTTSFTKGKGDEISLCLREKQTGMNKFHDIDLIKFVLLHELAHVISVSYDHGNEFWTNFKFILEFCQKYNIYNAPNYDISNVIYCGLVVKYNPVFDKTIKSFFY
jgi:hypothetical protein